MGFCDPTGVEELLDEGDEFLADVGEFGGLGAGGDDVRVRCDTTR